MKTLKLVFAVLVVMLMFGQCRYNFIIPEALPPVVEADPDNPTISFKTDIETIFNANNKCTACHTTGKQLPDLSTGNAFNSLNSKRYINTSSPEESLIYTKPQAGAGHTHQYTAAESAKVLLWIQEGAKNN